MEKKTSKKSWLFLTSALAAGALTILACADGDWGYDGSSMFAPELIESDAYKPFFRDTYYRLYGSNDDEASQKSLNGTNIAEWDGYFKHQVGEEALNYWLNEASLSQVDSMIFSLKGKPANLTGDTRKNTLAVADQAKATSFLFYLGFAKRNEAFSNVRPDWYDDSPKAAPGPALAKQISGGLKLLANVKDPFLKERYIFQIERLYYFNGQYNEAIAFYESNLAAFKEGGSMRWRALGYKAGALYKQQKYSEANYLYAQLYDGFEPAKTSAHYSFHPQNESDWKQSLALAKNNREKEVLWHLFGIYNDEQRAMKEIMAINPKSDLLDLLLVRSVNIAEENFNLDSYHAQEKETSPVSGQVNQKLVDFVNETATKANTAKPELWYMAAAYLSYAKKDFAMGTTQLKQAEKLTKKNKLAAAQTQLISLLGKIMQVKTLDEATENTFLPELNTLFDTNTPASLRTGYMRDWTRNTLARLYVQKGEWEKAELIYPRYGTERFKNTDNIIKMIAYLDNPQKTALEKFFLAHNVRQADEYRELLGIRYAHLNKLDEAMAAFKSIQGERKILYGNPFNGRIRDCHDCDHEAKQKVKYSNLSFMEKMIEMRATAQNKPEEAAMNYLLMGNGFYNMTYYGNARYFYDNNISNESEDNCALALKYYLLAYDKTSDRELKAKCLFMAAKCEQNALYNNWPKGYEGDFKSGIYFKKIKTDFSNTKYYNEIIRECGYFKTYITVSR